MFQDFFSYIDKGGLDWAFWLVIFILLAVEIFGWAWRIMNCPVCGGYRIIIDQIYEDIQCDIWKCSGCGRITNQEFN